MVNTIAKVDNEFEANETCNASPSDWSISTVMLRGTMTDLQTSNAKHDHHIDFLFQICLQAKYLWNGKNKNDDVESNADSASCIR